jgi:hypothetical protein
MYRHVRRNIQLQTLNFGVKKRIGRKRAVHIAISFYSSRALNVFEKAFRAFVIPSGGLWVYKYPNSPTA